MKAWAIARVNLVRMLRDRSNLVPMLLVPLIFIYLIGTQFGGEERATVAVAGRGPVADAVVDTLRTGDAVEVTRADAAAVRDQVAAGEVGLGAVVPDDAAATLEAGDRLTVEVVTRPEGDGAALQPFLFEALGEQALVPGLTAELAAGPGAPPAGEVRAAVEAAAAAVERTAVTVVDPEGGDLDRGTGRFSQGAASQLVLMVFLFTLFSAIPMVQSRQLGLARRMVGTPTSVPVIVAGEAAGRWLVALVQGAWILVASSLLFDVTWGDLPGTVAVLVAFGAVGAGAGMVLGSVLSDDGVVVAAGILLGLSLAALGGAMVPAELFSSTMETVSRLTPHAWALDALATLRDGGSLADIGVELGVLAAGAVALVGLASWRLRVVLTRV